MKRLLGQGFRRKKDDAIGGIPVDSEYIIFVIDTSGSMFNYVWPMMLQKMEETLNLYPKVKGFQVMNDEGVYMFTGYRGKWIPDTPAQRRTAIERLRTWNAFSNSSPIEGIVEAIRTYHSKDKKISLYVLGDEFTGSSIDSVVKGVDIINREDETGERRVRIHAIGFPVRPDAPQYTSIRFATLMRILCQRNGGTFVGLNEPERSRHEVSRSATLVPPKPAVPGATEAIAIMNTGSRISQTPRAARCGLGALALVALAGCGPVRLIANTNIPTPLVVKIPIAVALFIPKEFSTYVHNEERWSTDWHVELGKAQSDGITRLMNAMFERVVAVESVNAGQRRLSGGVRAILEPSIEEFAFVTPRDAGSPFFAVSIKYRVNIYLPDGKLADSWGFTGYGTSPAAGLVERAAAADCDCARDARCRREAGRRIPRAGDGARAAAARRHGRHAREAGVRARCQPTNTPQPEPGSAGHDGRSAREGRFGRRVGRLAEARRRAREDDARATAREGRPQAAAAGTADFQRPPSTASLRVRNTSRFVIPVVSTGSPLTNLGRKRAARIAVSASAASRGVPLAPVIFAFDTSPSSVTVNCTSTNRSSTCSAGSVVLRTAFVGAG